MLQAVSKLRPRGVAYSLTGHGNVLMPFGIAFIIGLIFSVVMVLLHIPLTNAVLKCIVDKDRKEAMKKETSGKSKDGKKSDRDKKSDTKDSKDTMDSKEESGTTRSKDRGHETKSNNK
uniref:Copper transporter n=1 Tax=Ascaris lumbricoides TaxID=6252 RepID=A0A0M3HN45_ASCLU